MIKNAFGKRFAVPLNLEFFKHPVYRYRINKNLIVRLELNSAENVILCCRDKAATYKLSDISLECNPILDVDYATRMIELYIKTDTQFTKVT